MSKISKNLVKLVDGEIKKNRTIRILKSINLKNLYSKKCPYSCGCGWYDPCSCDGHVPTCECISQEPYKGCGMR